MECYIEKWMNDRRWICVPIKWVNVLALICIQNTNDMEVGSHNLSLVEKRGEFTSSSSDASLIWYVKVFYNFGVISNSMYLAPRWQLITIHLIRFPLVTHLHLLFLVTALFQCIFQCTFQCTFQCSSSSTPASDIADDRECRICRSEQNEVAVQCTHQMCRVCASKLECPFCKEVITSRTSFRGDSDAFHSSTGLGIIRCTQMSYWKLMKCGLH